jgi:hypothetical protein
VNHPDNRAQFIFAFGRDHGPCRATLNYRGRPQIELYLYRKALSSAMACRTKMPLREGDILNIA